MVGTVGYLNQGFYAVLVEGVDLMEEMLSCFEGEFGGFLLYFAACLYF